LERLQARGEVDSKIFEMLAYAYARASTSVQFTGSHFSSVFRRVPVEDRQRITESWTPLPLLAAWRATRNLPSIRLRIQGLHIMLKAMGGDEAQDRLAKAAIEIYASANAHDLALDAMAAVRAKDPSNEFTVSITALLLAKKRDWETLAKLLDAARDTMSSELDPSSIRLLNIALRLYAKHHTSVETWKFVTALIDDLHFAPNKATNDIMLQSFVSRNDLDFMSKWFRFMRTLGQRFTMDSKLAVKLLTRYYLDFRPSHTVLMWLCHNLVHYVPSLAGQEFHALVKEAIAFD
ncbi:hypothetical protein LTR53_018146, partial [Teratosphaeriaceae sp. CCFEE 6253]